MSKPYRHLWRDITSFENLLLAFHKAARGKRSKPGMGAFRFNVKRQAPQGLSSIADKRQWPFPLLFMQRHYLSVAILMRSRLIHRTSVWALLALLLAVTATSVTRAQANREADAPAGVTTPAAATVDVHFDGTRFDPAELTVAVGTTVVWWNDTAVAHALTARGILAPPAVHTFLPIIVGSTSGQASAQSVAANAEPPLLFDVQLPASGTYSYTIEGVGQITILLDGLSSIRLQITSVNSGTPVPPTTTPEPTAAPTEAPTVTPSLGATPTATSGGDDTATPAPDKTPLATATPLTSTPTATPSDTPSTIPTNTPTTTPSNTPTATPSHTPTNTPTHTPTNTPPGPIAYRSFDGLNLTLYPFEGTHIALLVPDPSLNHATLRQIVATFDAAYAYYAAATGREPVLFYEFNGKATIAAVPSTCGAGCGYLGYTGIELQEYWFNRLYEGVASRNEYDQATFYELGRNFWFYGDKLEYVGADNTGAITTGYAVFMRFMSMDAAGVTPGPYNGWDFAYFRAEVEGLLDRYLADPALNWDNTLRAGVAPVNPIGLGATDLFASFLFELRARYGNGFVTALWHEAAQQPAASTTQDAVDNFVVASSAAAQSNLVSLFRDEWRWPVSDAAVQRIGAAWAAAQPDAP